MSDPTVWGALQFFGGFIVTIVGALLMMVIAGIVTYKLLRWIVRRFVPELYGAMFSEGTERED